MIIANSRQLISIRLRQFFLTILLMVVIYLLYQEQWFDWLKDVDQTFWTLFVIFIFVAMAYLDFRREYSYIYFTTTSEKIVFRFYPIRPFFNKKRAIEIPVNQLSGYKIEKSEMGLKKQLILMRSVKGKEIKYPPVSITALPGEQLKKIITKLDLLVH
jgi:hypothetical protein